VRRNARLGNPHTFTLERPTDEIRAAIHSDPGGVGAFDVDLVPSGCVPLSSVSVGRSPLNGPAEQGVVLGGGQGVTCIPFGAPHAAQAVGAVEVAAACSGAHSSVPHQLVR